MFLQCATLKHSQIKAYMVTFYLYKIGPALLWNTNWAFTRYDRPTDRSVRLVCPTGRSDDRIV